MTYATAAATTKATKKAKVADREEPKQPLLPGLPDHLSQLCLSRLSPTLLHSVCHSWRRLVYSPSFPPFLSLYALISSNNNTNNNSIQFSSFNPISASWQPLPPPPPDPLLRPLLLRHPSFIARELPIQSVAVSGCLALVAATTHHLLPALPRPLLFDPLHSQWLHGPPFSSPRRWCAAGAVSGALYVASGFGSYYNQDVARSAQRWPVSKMKNGGRPERWEKVAGLRDGKFSREAVEAVGWRGKLCMVNVKGNAPKEGVVYDVERDVWEEMKEGMLKGWNGPATAMDESEMYMVDEGRGELKRYDEGGDCWEVVAESEMLRGAAQMAAGGGRVCVVCGGAGGIVVVDVVARPVRVWVVEPPPESHVVAVHVLPRMSVPEERMMMDDTCNTL